jgi:hypothetical protein
LKAREQTQKRDLVFKTCQECPKTVMYAGRRPNFVLAAINAESMWILKHCAIAVACLNRSDDSFPGYIGQPSTSKSTTFRTVIMTGGANRRTSSTTPRASRESVRSEFLRMIRQQDNAIADQISRGQVSGKQ